MFVSQNVFGTWWGSFIVLFSPRNKGIYPLMPSLTDQKINGAQGHKTNNRKRQLNKPQFPISALSKLGHDVNDTLRGLLLCP